MNKAARLSSFIMDAPDADVRNIVQGSVLDQITSRIPKIMFVYKWIRASVLGISMECGHIHSFHDRICRWVALSHIYSALH